MRSKSIARLAWPAVLLAAACGGGEPDAVLRARPSVLLVSIDTLRADHLGCYGYDPYDDPVSPAIDGLAAQGTRLTHYFAPRGQTGPSMASTMSGRFPSSHGVRDNGMAFVPGVTTLAELLRAAGYRTAAFVSRFPLAANGHPARGVEQYVDGSLHPDGTPTQTFHEADEVVTARALEWLDERAPADDRPFFAWVHFFGVHKPYSPPPPYDTLFVRDEGSLLARATRGSPTPWEDLVQALDRSTLSGVALPEAERRYVLAVYDGALRAVDERVGRLLERLALRGLDQRTLVVLTSDHGEELGDHHGYWFHGNSIYDSTLRIPLIVRWPGVVRAGADFGWLAQNVDLAPTLLEWTGSTIPSEVEGRSLAAWLAGSDPPSDPPRSHGYLEWQDLVFGVRTLDSKLVLNPFGAWPRKSPYDRVPGMGFPIACEEHYALDQDPGELTNRLGIDPARLLALRERALAHRRRPAWIVDWPGAERDAGDVLDALGYVGSSAERQDVLLHAVDCE